MPHYFTSDSYSAATCNIAKYSIKSTGDNEMPAELDICGMPSNEWLDR